MQLYFIRMRLERLLKMGSACQSPALPIFKTRSEMLEAAVRLNVLNRPVLRVQLNTKAAIDRQRCLRG
jgi:hypothetical protein